MKPALFLSLSLLFAGPLFSQYHVFSGGENLGSEGILETSDGGYLLLAVEFCYTPGGLTFEGCTYALHVIRTDSTGEQQWETQLSYYSFFRPRFRLFENNDGSFTLIGTNNESYFCNGLGTWLGFQQIQIINLSANGGLISNVLFPDECELVLVDVIRMAGSQQFAVLAYFQDPTNYFNEPEGQLFLMNKNGQIFNMVFFPDEEFKGGRLLAGENGELNLLYMIGDQLKQNTYNAQLQLIGEATSADLSNTCLGSFGIRVEARRLNNGDLCLLCREFNDDEIHFIRFDTTLEILSSNSHVLDRPSNFIEDSEGNLIVASVHISPDTIEDTQINYFDSTGVFLDSVVIWHAEDDEQPAYLISTTAGSFALEGDVNFFNYDTAVGPSRIFLLIGNQLPPAASFSADVTCGQAPLTVSFQDHSLLNPVAWNWDFGNGQTSSEQNPTVTYESSGVYPVSLIATNAAGNDTLLLQDYITVVDPVVLTVAPGDTACLNTPLLLQASGAESYAWTGEGLSAETGASVEALPESPGTYVYEVTGTSNGCNAEPVSTEITVAPVPVVGVSASSDSICMQEFVTLVASGAETYSWEGEGLSSTTGDTVLASPSVAGEYIYTLVGSSLGCDSEPQEVTLLVWPEPEVSLTASADTLCEQDAVSLTASGAENYEWTGEGLSFTSGDTVFATPVAPGQYTYSVVGESNGCSSLQQEITVIVWPLPEVGLTASADTLCEQDAVSLTATGAENYEWTGEGLSFTTGDTVLAIPEAPGQYTYSVVGSSNGCSAEPAQVVITVGANPVPQISVFETSGNAENDGIICEGDAVNLTVAAFESILWSTGNSGQTIEVSPGETTAFSVIVVNEFGCTGMEELSVAVIPSPQVIVTLSPATVCLGDTFSLAGSGADTLYWNGPGLLSTYGDTVQVVAQDTGTFIYQVYGSSAGCLGMPLALTVEVEHHILSAEITVSNCPGPDLLFGVQVDNGGSSPQVAWYVNDQQAGTGPDYTLIGAQNGDEVYCLVTATDPPACTDPLQVLSNVILVECIETGTLEASSIFESYTLAPNPNEGSFQLDAVLLWPVRGRIRIFSALGQQVREQVVEWAPGRQVVLFELPEVSPGIYWVVLENGEQRYWMGRVVVE